MRVVSFTIKHNITTTKNMECLSPKTPEKKSKSVFDYNLAMHGFGLGDFVFGAREYRRPTIHALRSLGLGAVTVDEINFLQHRFVGLQTDTEFAEMASAIALEGGVARNYTKCLYLYMTFLFRNKHYDTQTIIHEKEQLWLSRSCKMAIIAAIEHKTTIHFILDGLDQRQLLDKEERHYEAFTSIELRSIFKTGLYHETSFVKFYKNGAVAPPPWEDPQTKGLWSSYLQSKE